MYKGWTHCDVVNLLTLDSLTLQSFGKLLNETVAGEKLSASKVDRVRDSAAKDFHVRGERRVPKHNHPRLILCTYLAAHSKGLLYHTKST